MTLSQPPEALDSVKLTNAKIAEPFGNFARNEQTRKIRELFDHTQRFFSDEDIDAASEAAIELIIEAGYDANDSDQLGDPMGDQLQSLLTVALLRCPDLANVRL